ncbi:MAG: hypothetical protein KKB09_07170 [Nanoarchaeota archaeon]|nr:hypothetical protein [Nanoarchaeota archaeon]
MAKKKEIKAVKTEKCEGIFWIEKKYRTEFLTTGKIPKLAKYLQSNFDFEPRIIDILEGEYKLEARPDGNENIIIQWRKEDTPPSKK